MLLADADIWKSLSSQEFSQLKGVLDVQENRLLWWNDPRIQSAWENREQFFQARFPDGLDINGIHYPDSPEATAIINYTSGTSGDPKGVMLSYKAMSDIVDYCQEHIYNAPENLVSMLPLAHIYGLAMEFIYPCCTGFSIYFLGKVPSPSLLIQSMSEIKPYLMITVPRIMEMLYNNLIRPQLSTRGARAIRTVPGLRTSFYRSVGKKMLTTLGGNLHDRSLSAAGL